MLPHNHFLIAGAVIAPAAMALSPELPPREIVEWTLIGGILSAAIDLDVVAIIMLRSRKEQRLRQFRSLFAIYRHFGLFMDTIAETGVLRTAMITHISLAVMLLLACALLSPHYLVPVALAVLSHIASDIPNVIRAMS